MMQRRYGRWSAVALIAGLCGTVGAAHAADVAKEGKLDVTECFVGEGPRMEIADGMAFGGQTTRSAGVSRTGSPSPLENYAAECVVVYVENKAGKSQANGYCVQTDADGDKFMSSFVDEGNQMAGTFVSLGGTGKYAGGRISGEFKPAGPLHISQGGHLHRCLHVTGTYKLR